MRVAASHQQALRQGDWLEGAAGRQDFARKQVDGIAEWIFQADLGRPGKNIFPVSGGILAPGIIAGILDLELAEVGLRAKITGGHAANQTGVGSPCSAQFVIASVADIADFWKPHQHREGKKRDFRRVKLDVARPYAPKSK